MKITQKLIDSETQTLRVPDVKLVQWLILFKIKAWAGVLLAQDKSLFRSKFGSEEELA